jgi:predicted ferric reductase
MPDGRGRTAWVVLAAVIVFPVVLWLLAGSVEERFSGDAVLKSVANLGALVGFSAWAANLTLASRARPIERAVGGIERLYRAHRRIGLLVVTLVAIHVVFLTLYSTGDAVDLYLPTAGWETFTGVIALVLLVGFVVASLVRRLPYQTFLLIQRLLGIAFLLGALHTFAIGGTPAASAALTAYLACLAALGVAGVGYRMAGGRLGLGRHSYRVDEVRELADDVVEIVMAPVGRPIEFLAGQFVYAAFDQNGIPCEPHPFTIASSPGGSSLRLAVKRLGDFTGAIMELRPGCGAQLEGPFGDFCLRASDHPQTWIAGGIGITPFLSWARSIKTSLPADLYYCMAGAEHAHFLEELYDIADRHPTLRVIPMRKQSLGWLSATDIAAVNPNLANSDIFICGPPLMIDNLATGLLSRGIPPDRIRSERFDFR